MLCWDPALRREGDEARRAGGAEGSSPEAHPVLTCAVEVARSKPLLEIATALPAEVSAGFVHPAVLHSKAPREPGCSEMFQQRDILLGALEHKGLPAMLHPRAGCISGFSESIDWCFEAHRALQYPQFQAVSG